MALFFGESNTTRRLLSAESVPWASVGARPFTHFVIVDTTSISGDSQYWWSTGNFNTPNTLNMYMGFDGNLTSRGYSGSATSVMTSPTYGGGMRFLAVRSKGGNGDNNSGDWQSVFCILKDGEEVSEVSESSFTSLATIANNTLGNNQLLIGDRMTMEGTRAARGYIYMAGSFNKYLSNGEIKDILSGKIRILDHLKYDIVELWDFQKDNDVSMFGLVQHTQLRMIGDGWEWGNRYPDLKIHPSLLFNKSRYSLIPIRWANESKTPTDIIECSSADIDITSQQSYLSESEALSTNVVDILVSPYNAGMQIRDFILTPPVDIGITTFPCYVSGKDVISTGVEDISLTSTKSDVVLKGEYVVDVGTEEISVSSYNVNIKETNVVNTSPQSIDITTNSASVLGESVVDCVSEDINLSPYNSGIILEGMYVVDVDIADIDVSSTNASTVLSGEYTLGCTSYDIDLSAEDAHISQSSGISTNVVDIDITPYQCGVKQEGVAVINVTTNVIDISTYSVAVKENTNIDVDSGSVDITSSECSILEFRRDVIECREADIDVSSYNSDVHLQGEYIVHCTPNVIDINTANAGVSTYNNTTPDEIDIDTYSADVIEFPYAIINCDSVDLDIETYDSLVSRGNGYISIYHEDIILYEGNLVIILRE